MRAPYPMHIDVLDAMKELTIDIRVKVHNVWRLKFGAFLLRLAA